MAWRLLAGMTRAIGPRNEGDRPDLIGGTIAYNSVLGNC
jgi:hypothetical protein